MYVIVKTRYFKDVQDARGTSVRTVISDLNGASRKFISRAAAQKSIRAIESVRCPILREEVHPPTYQVWAANAKGIQGLFAG